MGEKNSEELLKYFFKCLPVVIAFIRTKPYGIIHKREIISYDGNEGYLVWDYLIYNELTFEDRQTGKKLSLGTSFSDTEIEAEFNRLVEKYG